MTDLEHREPRNQFPEKLIPMMILNCLNGEPLPVYGDGRNIRDWLHVDDHAAAIWLIVRRGRRSESYNAGGDCQLENIDLLHRLIDVIAAQTDRDGGELRELITFVKDRPGHDRRYAIDATKLHTELDWRPRHNIDSGLEQTVAWYLANQDWVDGVRSGAYRTWVDRNYRDR